MELVWDKIGERLYETGVDKGVLYPLASGGIYPKGVAWNGLSAVNESPSGAEPTPVYANNYKYLNLLSAEEFGATIEAFTYPNEFEPCNGSVEVSPGVTIGQQTRKTFGLAYRTILGNDIDYNDYGYKIHLVYGALAAPSEKNNSTVNASTEPTALSWTTTTTPVPVPGFKPTATIVIDSTKVDPDDLKALEEILYGTNAVGEEPAKEARLPLPAEVFSIIPMG